jgi:hypothetical protein
MGVIKAMLQGDRAAARAARHQHRAERAERLRQRRNEVDVRPRQQAPAPPPPAAEPNRDVAGTAAAGVVPYVDLERFGGGVGDPQADSAAFTAALERVSMNGGGTLMLHPKTYCLSGNWIWDSASSGPLVIIGYGATVRYEGTGEFLTLTAKGTAARHPACKIIDGHYVNAGQGTRCFVIQDHNMNRFFDVWIHDFTETQIEFRIVNEWCEQNIIDNCTLGTGESGRHCILFTPAADKASFARTRVTNTTVAGGGSSEHALIHCAGGVYDSTFEHVGGNTSHAGAPIMHLSGAMGGTWINNLGFEGGASVGFEVGEFTGTAPFIGPAIDFRGKIQFSSKPDFRGAAWANTP